MRHEEKLLFISSFLISFSLVFSLGGGKKTMKLNNDMLKSDAIEISMLLNNGAIR